MHSTKVQRLSLIVVVGLMLSSVLACDLGRGAGAAKPRVTFESPVGGLELEVGQQVEIVCMVEDPKGVVSVELAVDGVLYATQESPNPEGQPQWKFVESWAAKVNPGIHTLTITAHNVDQVASDPVSISVTVVAGAAPEATGEVTLATGTPPPGTTGTAPSPGTTETASAPAPTPTTGAPVPTRTTPAPPPTNTSVAPRPTDTPVPPQPPTNTPVPGLPDLIISAINLDRDMVPYGGTVHAQVVVLNQGNASAGAFRVTWDFGSGNGGHDVPCCLAPNQSYAMEWTSLPLSTSYNTLATADENQTVQESNEANNRRWQWLNVELPTIDLDLVAIGGISDRARWGQQAYADIVVKNNGNGPSGPFFARCVFCPDVCEWNVDSLGPSEERELSVCSIVLYPPCDWRCYIDPANTVQESNEDNNSSGTRLDLIP